TVTRRSDRRHGESPRVFQVGKWKRLRRVTKVRDLLTLYRLTKTPVEYFDVLAFSLRERR
ncbi:MAG TPA: hypothetical protein VLM38_21395, partial [Blastocatellia bacterium]|nr:hypothetical protein [Blastocatellia bacterium]